MKTNITLQSLAIFTGVALLAGAGSARAQVYAYDDASGYFGAAGNAAWLFSTTTNGGYGFMPWVFTKQGSDFQGFYVGNPSGISTNGNAWGMYANGPTANDSAAAYRSFSNSLPVNAVFTLRWSNHGIGNAGHQGGFSLRNGNANASTADTETGSRFDFYFVGGGLNSFSISDGNGPVYINLPFASGPFQVEFTLLTADTYRFVIKDPTGVNVITSFDNQPLAGAGTIDSVALYALQTDGDQVFNRMAIYSSSLVPPDIAIVSPTNGSVYQPTSTSIAFNVTSAVSGVSSNNVKLALNGVNVTNLSFSGTTASWAVTATPVLTDNVTYNGTITAVDANGNHATNTFTFNTWRSDNPFIEAADYNYSSGNFPNPAFPDVNDSLFANLGSNGVDYLEYDTTGTTHPNAYRPGDLPQVEASADTVDHAGYIANSLPIYNLGFIERFEWENYTRVMSNQTYAVYARMAGFGNNPTMDFERMANPTATTTDQPHASLGTFVCPNTGGATIYTMVQLKDFFSNPVEVNFPGTTTFRATSLADDGSYNFAYLIFVPSTNTSTLRPYLSAGFPYPGVTGVQPDQGISFTIANRQTSVNPATIKLLVNTIDVTSGITLSNNAAGTVVSYVSPSLFASNSTNTLTAIYTDNAGSPVTTTNTWQFFVVTYQVVAVPAAYAVPPGSIDTAPGFAIRINKARDDAPTTDFPATLLRAEHQLANLIVDNSTTLPYVNLATNASGSDLFAETNTMNYDITGAPTGGFTFPAKSAFPYIATSGTNNFIAMEALMYLQLAPGTYRFAVRSDDGFQLSTGPTPGNTNTILALFDGGRGNGTPMTFFFTVPTAGLYPMRLLYCQGEFSGNIEFYSIDHATGASTLINDPSSPSSIKAFQGTAVLLLNPAHAGSSSSFSFTTLAGHTHTVQFKNALTDPLWSTFLTIPGDGSVTNIVDSTASGARRFYHVVTQ
jgi:hypothetical protein